MCIERASFYDSSTTQVNRSFAIENFLDKIDGGVDLESLIMADSLLQKKTGREIRKASREMQKKAFETAIKKMKAAASNRMLSTIFGAALDVCASLGGYGFEKLASAGKISGTSSKLCAGLMKAGSEVLKATNPFGLKATEEERSAKSLEQASEMEAERAGDAKELIQSARDLEQRMLANIEKADQNEHQTRIDLARRIGG